MAQAVFGHDGTRDDFKGDDGMAVFGTSEPRVDDATRALACAHNMRGIIASWNLERAFIGKPPVAVGIGLHVGTVVARSTGSLSRLKFALVGDVVKVAIRQQPATRQLCFDMVVSQDAMLAAKGDPAAGSRREVSLRGHAAAVDVVVFE